MKIVFRVDASLQMGSGHVMRCLTLADALRSEGAHCHFISREHPGHLLQIIRQRGHSVTALQACNSTPAMTANKTPNPVHAEWLGCDWQIDAQETAEVLADQPPDWLVVDHYALDQCWEEVLAPHSKKLMVIDDLADRPHCCDLLLDQNLGRHDEHYSEWVPAHCRVLTGPQYALLRPEFSAMRPYSLKRRQTQPALRQLLVTMGGVDLPNATGQVLQALKNCALPAECRITVVMGLTAPWLPDVQALAKEMPWSTEVVVNVSDMARRMADSDLAIGAAGSSSWERCCLGVPTLMVVLADNQRAGAKALDATLAARWLGTVSDISRQLPIAVVDAMDADCLNQMSLAASTITEGQGAEKILKSMTLFNV